MTVLVNNLCEAVVAFWYKNGPEGCAIQMGTILKASLWDSADKPPTQVPVLVLMEIWAGKMPGSCNSSLLRSLKMVCFAVHPYKRAQILLQVGFYPKLLSLQWECIAWSKYKWFWSTSLTQWKWGALPPACLPAQWVQGLVIFTLPNSGESSWFPGVTLMKRSRKMNS